MWEISGMSIWIDSRQLTKIIIRNLPLRIFAPCNCLMAQMIQMYQDLVQRSQVFSSGGPFQIISLPSYWRRAITRHFKFYWMSFWFVRFTEIQCSILKGSCCAKLIIDRDENKIRPLIKKTVNSSMPRLDHAMAEMFWKWTKNIVFQIYFVIVFMYLFVIYLFGNILRLELKCSTLVKFLRDLPLRGVYVKISVHLCEYMEFCCGIAL